MKLIKIETKGFKSFAEKTILEFNGDIVGIVGPNGSGKSNINDAIKWVLGEGSPKSLRGDSMEDVIFSGSKTFSPLNEAYVSLIFDNNENVIDWLDKKIVITRKLERGKTSLYFINDKESRLKDVKDIVSHSGISKSSLAIISQDTVQNIAQAQPEQRRLFFEEAAGISKFKLRKNESLKKIEKISVDLEKIETITKELEKQLKPLEKQAQKAKIYLEKYNSLKEIEVSLLINDINFSTIQLKKLEEELKTFFENKDNLEFQINQSNVLLKNKNEHKITLENEINELDKKYQSLLEEIENISTQNNEIEQRKKMILSGEIKVDKKIEVETILEQINFLNNQINFFKKINQDIDANFEENKNEFNKLENEKNLLNKTVSQKNYQLVSLKARVDILKEQIENKSFLFKGVKNILDNKHIFPNVEGIVGQILKISPDLRVAIESVLSSSLQNIVVKDSQTAVNAINFLKQNKAGKATFLPLEYLRPKGIMDEHLEIAKTQKGFIGVASDLVQTESKYDILKKNLLGNILVSNSIEDSNQLFKIFKNYTIVSIDGQLIRAGGIMSGGFNQNSQNILGLEDDLIKIQEQIPLIETQMKELLEQKIHFESKINQINLLIKQNKEEMNYNKEKINFYVGQLNMLKLKYEEISKTKLEIVDNDLTLDNIHFLEELKNKKNSLNLLLMNKKEFSMNLSKEISQLNLEKNEYEKSLIDLLKTSSNKLNEKEKAIYFINTSKKRLSEEYNLIADDFDNDQSSLENEEKVRDKVNILKKEIKDLGYINLDSIEEFEKLNERYKVYKESEDEIFEAKQKIIKAINQMDKIMIEKLDKMVQGANKEMPEIFKTMFGGGHAEIKYTDPKNILESGIEVIAQPPGKTIKNIKLFSGGEKSLLAISLLFSILKSKPLPLCILDEVEAALDEVNVIKYANFLQQLKEKTQFLVITHRVGTMSRVDKLFGVTMQKQGVTSFFSVKMNEAKKLLN